MKRSGLSVIAIVLGASLTLLTACKKVEEPAPKVDSTPAPQAMPETTPPAASTTPAAPAANGTAATDQSARESTLQSARQELDQMKTRIDALKAKAKDATADMQAKINEETQGFDKELATLETKYNDLKDASASAWQDMKASFDTAIAKLKDSLEKSDQQASKTGKS